MQLHLVGSQTCRPREVSVPTPFQHVYLSPHLDDAVFSCGGTIASQRARGDRVLVVTVCAGLPPADAPPPALLREGLRNAGLTTRDFVQWRREEDRRALTVLGVDFEWAEGLDAIYRLPDAYGTISGLSGEIAPNDPLIEFAAKLARSVAPGAILYAPLGVGEHVDHRIVCAGAMQAPRPVFFYEDFPYGALAPDTVARRLAAVGVAMDPVLTDVSANLQKRSLAISSYASQTAALGDLDALFTTHAKRLGGGVPVERMFAGRTL